MMFTLIVTVYIHEDFSKTAFYFLPGSLVSHEINTLFKNGQREGAGLQESCPCYQDEVGCLLQGIRIFFR